MNIGIRKSDTSTLLPLNLLVKVNARIKPQINSRVTAITVIKTVLPIDVRNLRSVASF